MTQIFKGIRIDNKEIKLAAFADDLTTFLLDKVSLGYLSNTMRLFGECSGLKLNDKKTKAHWLGSSHNCEELLSIETVKKPIKIPGTFFTYNWHWKQELNFSAILDSLRKSLNSWQWRNLTIMGKIQVIKSFALSKFMYRASLISLDKTMIKTIDSVMFKFLWKGKDKIKWLALISDYKDGGLRLPHIESAITTQRMMCLKKFTESYFSPWKAVLSYFLKDYGGNFISRCNFKPSDILYDHLSSFYCDCLTAWSTINNKRISSSSQVLDEILWNNQFLRIGNKPLFSKKLFAKGIVHVSDIFSDDGRLLSWDHFRGKGLNFNDYLLIFGLSKALPGSWRNLLHTENNNKSHQNERHLDLSVQLNDESVSISTF